MHPESITAISTAPGRRSVIIDIVVRPLLLQASPIFLLSKFGLTFPSRFRTCRVLAFVRRASMILPGWLAQSAGCLGLRTGDDPLLLGRSILGIRFGREDALALGRCVVKFVREAQRCGYSV